MFTREQLQRYGRQIVLPGVGGSGQERLLRSSVLVVGAGGLGSPVALYLAAAGVGRVTLLDDDSVDLSNLQRQVLHDTGSVGELKTASGARRLRALNPDVEVREVRQRLEPANAREQVRGHDVVVDGSDAFETRYALNDACFNERVPLVYGALSRFDGQVSVFQAYAPAGVTAASLPTPCYRCVYPHPPPPGAAPTCAEAGVLGPLPGAIGSLMAGEALKLLLGIGSPLWGRLLVLDLLEPDSRIFDLARDPGCVLCALPGPTIDAPIVTAP